MKGIIWIVLAVIIAYRSLSRAQEVEVKKGDSLWKIVEQYLGDGMLWREIGEYNRLKNPFLIYPGDIIEVPYISRMKLTSIFGDVKIKKEDKEFVKIKEETPLSILDQIETSSESRAVLEFEDGSVVNIKPNTKLQIKMALIDREKKGLVSKLRMSLGKIFLKLTPTEEKTKFEVETPASLCGARGTVFQTSHTMEAISRVEVFEGGIKVEAEEKSVEVPSGYGSSIAANQPPLAPRPLPDPPELISPPDNITTSNQRPRLEWAKVPAAKSYHIELARDRDFNDVVQEAVLEETNLITVGLPERQYYWHVSSIEETKLEGAFSQPRSINIVKEMGMLFRPNRPLQEIRGKNFASESWSFAIDTPAETSIVKIEINIDGSGFKGYQPPYSFKKEGEHEIEYRTIDVFGEPGPAQKVKVFLDLTPPEISIKGDQMIEYEDNLFALKEGRFAILAEDKLSGIKEVLFKVDQGDFKEYKKPFVITKEGLHKIKCQAMDNVENWSEQELRVIIDSTPPEIGINCDKMIEYESKYFAPIEGMFSLSARDDFTKVEKILVKVDQGDFKEYRGPFLMDTQGLHTISYRAIDRVGNCSDEEQLQVITDAVPPEIGIICDRMIENESKYFAPLEGRFTLSARDEFAGVTKILVKVDQGEFKEYREPFLMDTPGLHTISYKAIDRAGNCSDEEQLQVITDAVPPEIGINCDKMIEYESKYFAPIEGKFSISARDEFTKMAKILVKVDQGEFKEYREPFLINTPGLHTISYKAIDRVGNCSDEEDLRVITDAAPPEIDIVCNTRMIRYKCAYLVPVRPEVGSFRIMSLDKESGLNKILLKVDDDKEFKEYKEPVVITKKGGYIIKCKASDRAGNWSSEKRFKIIMGLTRSEYSTVGIFLLYMGLIINSAK